MNPNETQELLEFVKALNEDGYTIAVIEHDMKLVMGISERIHVLDFGEKIAEGDPETIRKNEKVIEAYLGPGEMSGGD
jgi:branched-chain amino acid transport system ATP-binding protein